MQFKVKFKTTTSLFKIQYAHHGANIAWDIAETYLI